MRIMFQYFFQRLRRTLWICASLWVAPQVADAAGVTLITHGLNGNVDGWVTGMADQIRSDRWFPGTNYTLYLMSFVPAGGGYALTVNRVAGREPLAPASGQIIVKLDWRQLADGNSYNTYQVAAAVVPALLNTNFISELGGHALAEYPLHLIGHSRGGSLVCELSRQLGTNGVWVDHVTTLDPHPLNDTGFPFDFVFSAVDAPARTYVNVLFHDNYWQNSDFFAFGKAVPGGYVRKLTALGGGYGGAGGAHSDVHLWYHGTIQSNTPASDTEVSITSSERTTWWTGYESNGLNAGFLYSLVGGGDRTSNDRPVGVGQPAIRDGFNQWWDLGAGGFSNRTTLPANNGSWPSLILFRRTQTNQVLHGQSTPVQFYYQWAKADTNLASVGIYLDADLNPLNTNQTLLQTLAVPTNGASYVSLVTTNLIIAATNVAPGVFRLYASITGGGQTRYLYAPESVEVVANTQPPVLDVTQLADARVVIGINGVVGQTLVLHTSTNLQTWQPLATNSLTASSRWLYTNNLPADAWQQYFRATLKP